MDPRTDRVQLTTVAYGTGDLLADRQQIYSYAVDNPGPLVEWLFDLAGGVESLVEPILDVGTGNGDYVRALEGRRVAVGADLSRGMLEGVRRSGFGGPLVEGDGQDLPLAEGSIGTALANHMLYHVPDIARAVSELRRVLRRGGTLLAVTNGAGHLVEIGRPFDEAVTELAGERRTMDKSGVRFNLDNGTGLLAECFDDVSVHHRRIRLVVPEPGPVMRYLASWVGLAPALPDGVSFEAVLAAVEPRVHAVFEAQGAFVIHAHAGAFVCR